MTIRTVRMNEEDERRLQRIVKATGLTPSAVFKRGLEALEATIPTKPQKTAWEIYSELDLGPGGYATDRARNSSAAAREAILRKHGRKAAS